MIGCPYDAYKIGFKYAPKSGLVLEFGVSFGTSIKQISNLISNGADIIDIGAASSKPGSKLIDPRKETNILEIGPGKVLTGLVKRIDKDVIINSINSEEDIKKININD